MTTTNTTEPILVDGQWVIENASKTFSSKDPSTSEQIDRVYPVSSWETCDRVLEAAHRAFQISRNLAPAKIADFLEDYASRIQADSQELVEIANRETALPKSPRLADVELPRTVNQLRLAAEAARNESWRMPIIDRKANIRSCYMALGPVAVF
ncbi:MAG: aldehyde dehydrogenase family protein, partial [Planctomycetota bacterium]